MSNKQLPYHTTMGARRGGQEGALAPPLEIQKYGGPHKDNLTRKNLKIYI